ncbi:MAG: DUF4340 domain-containing protein [Spirochaetaceae bacterium]
MSFRKKLSFLLSLIVLLSLFYFAGTAFTPKSNTEEKPYSLLSKEELASIKEIEIPFTHTNLLKEDGRWYLKGAVDDSLLIADQKTVEAFLKELEDIKIYAQTPLESDGWSQYSSSADIEVTLLAEKAVKESSEAPSGDIHSKVIRIGDRVPGTKRRYVKMGENKVYEADDVLELVGSPHEKWADLSLFDAEFNHSNLLSLEIVLARELKIEDVFDLEDTSEFESKNSIRLERMVSDDNLGAWKGFIRERSLQNSFTPERDKVERFTDTLMRVKGSEYLGRRGSDGVESLIDNVVMRISMERGGASGETLEMYETVGGDKAVMLSNGKGEGLADKAVFSLSEETYNRILRGASEMCK